MPLSVVALSAFQVRTGPVVVMPLPPDLLAAHDSSEARLRACLSALPVPNQTCNDAVLPALSALHRIRLAAERVLSLPEPSELRSPSEMSPEAEELFFRWFVVNPLLDQGAYWYYPSSRPWRVPAPGLGALLMPYWTDTDSNEIVRGCSDLFKDYLLEASPTIHAAIERHGASHVADLGMSLVDSKPGALMDYPETPPGTAPTQPLSTSDRKLWRAWLPPALGAYGTDKEAAGRLASAAIRSRTLLMDADYEVAHMMGPRSETVLRSMAAWSDSLVRLCENVSAEMKSYVAMPDAASRVAVDSARSLLSAHTAQVLPWTSPDTPASGTLPWTQTGAYRVVRDVSFEGCKFRTYRPAVGSAWGHMSSDVANRVLELWSYGIAPFLTACDSVMKSEEPVTVNYMLGLVDGMLPEIRDGARKARWHMIRNRRGRRLWL